jgi:hypothetical protein
VIRMTHAGLVVEGPEPAFEAARDAFDRLHCLRLEGFVDRSLLAVILRELTRAPFYDRTHDGIGTELCLSEGTLSAGLEFLWNAPAVLDVVHRLTGCGPFGCFEGRVYRMKPDTGHYDSWHSDVGQDRQVAMSVNLSEGVYEGGATEFRRVDAREPFHRVANVGFGDAILFRIDPALRHQVTEVTGTHDKTAYAGWFRTQPDFRSLFAERHGGL